MSQITDQILASYEQVGGINHIDGVNLPSKTAIAALAQDLLRLLFPGFFSDKPVHTSDLRRETENRLAMMMSKMEDEIYKSLEYSQPEGLSPKEFAGSARQLTLECINQIPRLRELLQTDTEAAFAGDPAALSKEEVIVAYPFMEAIAVQRMAHELFLRHIPLLPRIMTEWAHARTGIDLHPGATIGTHFFIDHGTGTVVGETCQIGNRVKMYHGVTLGAKSTSDVEALRGRKRHPTIEDEVTIYPGATILGGDTVIGAGSTIGGNVFLTNSVPPHSLVIFEGVTSKVMKKQRQPAAAIDYEI